jgi:hypothetical protein
LHSRQSEYIHFVDGILHAPGLIDLSNLRFVAVGESYAGGGDGLGNDDFDEDEYGNQDDEGDVDEGEDGGNRRRLEDETENAGDGNDPLLSGTALDIVVFHLVSRLLCCRSADMTETDSQEGTPSNNNCVLY